MSAASEQKFTDAQQYLKSVNSPQGVNLYQHISGLLTKILDERPAHIVDIFEDLSLTLKEQKATGITEKPRELWLTQAKLSEELRPLFSGGDDDDGGANEVSDEDLQTPLPNVMETAFMLEQAGFGLSREEVFRVSLALKQLIDTHPLQKCRFWGKILGTKYNYYVAECEYREGEEEEEEEEAAEEADKEEEEKDEDAEEEEEDVLPKNEWKPPPPVPKEDKGTGVNKYTYFVTNDPGKPWTKLPSVTPQQIQVSRKIRKYFTGVLETPIVSYPPFNGTEINYLRAQIARISAGTQISPLGFYTFDEEEEAEEDDGSKDHYIENPEFEPLSVKDLCDPSGANWTHHVQYVLPQGRCSFVNPNQKSEEEFEEEEDDEDKEEGSEEIEPETGPALLTPISEDAEIDGLPPWTVRCSSERMPFHAVAYVRSNLWPGAFAFAQDRKFENCYVGFGLKYSRDNYTPPVAPPACEEFANNLDVAEMDDPTAEEEAAAKAAAGVDENGEEEGGEEEEDEEDD